MDQEQQSVFPAQPRSQDARSYEFEFNSHPAEQMWSNNIIWSEPTPFPARASPFPSNASPYPHVPLQHVQCTSPHPSYIPLHDVASQSNPGIIHQPPNISTYAQGKYPPTSPRSPGPPNTSLYARTTPRYISTEWLEGRRNWHDKLEKMLRKFMQAENFWIYHKGQERDEGLLDQATNELRGCFDPKDWDEDKHRKDLRQKITKKVPRLCKAYNPFKKLEYMFLKIDKRHHADALGAIISVTGKEPVLLALGNEQRRFTS